MTGRAEIRSVHEDHDLVALVGEYTGLSPAQVAHACNNYGHFNRLHWDECEGGFEERARQFYGQAHGYLFDVAFCNRSKSVLEARYRHFGHWPWMEASGPDVLEFGGGAGLACSLFRDLGRNVTYVDVEGPVSQFARWYFDRTSQNDIEVLITPVDRLELPAERTWDFVFTDAVLEHLVDPAPTVDRLARAVRPGGTLYMIIDAHNTGPDFPMHRDVHVDDLIARAPALARMQHVLHDGDNLNVFRQPR